MPESAATPSDLERFLARTRDLLAAERAADAERGALLLSSCSPRELERAGLALGGLSVASLSIGLGGKTYLSIVFVSPMYAKSNDHPFIASSSWNVLPRIIPPMCFLRILFGINLCASTTPQC